VAGVACFLQADYERRQEQGEGDNSLLRYTHVLLVDVDTDIRDDFKRLQRNGHHRLSVCSDQNGTWFRVVFVELQGRGLASRCKKVYLDRYLPSWPTNDL